MVAKEELENRAEPLLAPRRRIRHMLDRKELEHDRAVDLDEVKEMLSDLDPETEVDICHSHTSSKESYEGKSPGEVSSFIMSEYGGSRSMVHGWHQEYAGAEESVHYIDLADTRIKQQMGDDIRLGRRRRNAVIKYTE